MDGDLNEMGMPYAHLLVPLAVSPKETDAGTDQQKTPGKIKHGCGLRENQGKQDQTG